MSSIIFKKNIIIINKIKKLQINNLDYSDYKNYLKISKQTKKLIINYFLEMLNNKIIPIEVCGINLIYPNSPIFSSTSFGYLLESFILSNGFDINEIMEISGKSTNQSPYDAKFSFKNLDLFINFKTEKEGSVNNGVLAFKQLIKLYLENTKPKLYLILKFHYKIIMNEGIQITNVTGYFIEQFITNNIKTDKRSWSNNAVKKNNICYNGRLQKTDCNKDVCDFQTIYKILENLKIKF